MNVAFFLTPKNDVVCLNDKCTMRQALERMEYHRYTAVPLVDDKGKYVGTLTEGDLLWKIKNSKLNFKDTHRVLIKDIPMRMKNKAVSINADMDNLISLAKDQNFIPVVDDNGIFIGIIKRSDIISYCYNIMLESKPIKPTIQFMNKIKNFV